MVGDLTRQLAYGTQDTKMAENDSEINFPGEVQANFSFLKEEGFLPSCTSSNEVRYESNKVYINVNHGKQDGEVSILFGRIGNQEEFSFTLFLRLVNPNLEKSLGERLAYQPTQVRECLADLANALRSEGKLIIDGDDGLFDRMKSVRWWHFNPKAIK